MKKEIPEIDSLLEGINDPDAELNPTSPIEREPVSYTHLADVAFGMNHSHGYRVTRGYVKLDFTPAWVLNAKVIDFVFFSDEKSKQGKAKDLEESKEIFFRISKKMMIYARAYFKGKVIAEVTDIGFNTIDDVIKRLVPYFPKDMPEGCAVQFRLENCDSHKEIVYERTKGKGF